MRIGVDDTDSPEGMCTTYLGMVLIKRLINAGFSIKDRMLVRLNPNVRYKTRGNAAICIEVEGRDARDAFEIACACVQELADFSCENTNPGVVVINEEISSVFYKKALRHFCTIEETEELLKKEGALFRGWKNRRGLIGATAAVSAAFPDYTYELLAYRNPQDHSERFVDRESVFIAEATTYPHTWDSVDIENDAVVCVPHTPDPVIFGIRGESPKWVDRARSAIISEEPVAEEVYRTNQGTDAHLTDGIIGEMLDGRSYSVWGSVSSFPDTGRGGHVLFNIEDNESSVRCMAYEPTKGFRNIIRHLIPGDRILAVGSFKGDSINLEKIYLDSPAKDTITKPPVCKKCKKRMTSAGTGKGWKCKKCSARAFEPEIVTIQRTIQTGWYEVPPIARRHLSKPLVREIRERETPAVDSQNNTR